MPTIALPLFVVALVPLIFFAFGAVGQNPETAGRMLVSLIDYAALILGFSGGVHWGLGLWPEAARPTARFVAGTVPLIVAWIALILAQFVAPGVALGVLSIGYLATVLTEHRASRLLLVPPRYVWARWGFSLVAIILFVMVLLLRAIGQTIVF